MKRSNVLNSPKLLEIKGEKVDGAVSNSSVNGFSRRTVRKREQRRARRQRAREARASATCAESQLPVSPAVVSGSFSPEEQREELEHDLTIRLTRDTDPIIRLWGQAHMLHGVYEWQRHEPSTYVGIHINSWLMEQGHFPHTRYSDLKMQVSVGQSCLTSSPVWCVVGGEDLIEAENINDQVYIEAEPTVSSVVKEQLYNYKGNGWVCTGLVNAARRYLSFGQSLSRFNLSEARNRYSKEFETQVRLADPDHRHSLLLIMYTSFERACTLFVQERGESKMFFNYNHVDLEEAFESLSANKRHIVNTVWSFVTRGKEIFESWVARQDRTQSEVEDDPLPSSYEQEEHQILQTNSHNFVVHEGQVISDTVGVEKLVPFSKVTVKRVDKFDVVERARPSVYYAAIAREFYVPDARQAYNYACLRLLRAPPIVKYSALFEVFAEEAVQRMGDAYAYLYEARPHFEEMSEAEYCRYYAENLRESREGFKRVRDAKALDYLLAEGLIRLNSSGRSEMLASVDKMWRERSTMGMIKNDEVLGKAAGRIILPSDPTFYPVLAPVVHEVYSVVTKRLSLMFVAEPDDCRVTRPDGVTFLLGPKSDVELCQTLQAEKFSRRAVVFCAGDDCLHFWNGLFFEGDFSKFDLSQSSEHGWKHVDTLLICLGFTEFERMLVRLQMRGAYSVESEEMKVVMNFHRWLMNSGNAATTLVNTLRDAIFSYTVLASGGRPDEVAQHFGYELTGDYKRVYPTYLKGVFLKHDRGYVWVPLLGRLVKAFKMHDPKGISKNWSPATVVRKLRQNLKCTALTYEKGCLCPLFAAFVELALSFPVKGTPSIDPYNVEMLGGIRLSYDQVAGYYETRYNISQDDYTEMLWEIRQIDCRTTIKLKNPRWLDVIAIDYGQSVLTSK